MFRKTSLLKVDRPQPKPAAPQHSKASHAAFSCLSLGIMAGILGANQPSVSQHIALFSVTVVYHGMQFIGKQLFDAVVYSVH